MKLPSTKSCLVVLIIAMALNLFIGVDESHAAETTKPSVTRAQVEQILDQCSSNQTAGRVLGAMFGAFAGVKTVNTIIGTTVATVAGQEIGEEVSITFTNACQLRDMIVADEILVKD